MAAIAVVVTTTERPSGASRLARALPVQTADAGLLSQALYGWGSDDWGQLANGSSGGGTPTPIATPGVVPEPEGMHFLAVAAGGSDALGLTTSGEVFSWGTGFTGQLGLGADQSATSPQEVDIPGGPVVAVAVGSSHDLALTSAGGVYAWGANLFGQLGDGNTASADTPVPVSLPPGVRVTAIAAGGDHSLALTATGTILAWGANTDGQLGDGSTTSSDVPVAVPGPPGASFTAVAAGTGHSLALTATGQAYAWGFDASGQLGDGSLEESTTMVPVSMPQGTRFSAIAAGSSHSLALTTTGQVYAWGSDVFGQLDSALVDDQTVDSNVPIQPLGLPPLTTFVSIDAGLDSSYALTSTGVPWVWGGNAAGQLGVGAPGLDGVLPEALSTLPAGTLATGVFSGPDASAAFLVTRAVQSVVFPPLPSPTYGDPPLDMAPVASSGLPLTNVASGACSGPLTRLELTAAGLCTLTSTQPGNFWYYPVTATASFPIARAPLTIVPDDATATVGEPPTSFGYRLLGFRNHDPESVVSGSAVCTSPAGPDSLVGSYPITCSVGSLSAANYLFVPGPSGVLDLVAAAAGYIEVGTNGAVYALGPESEATAPIPPFFGAMAGQPLNAPVVAAAFTPRHNGYWLASADGGIFSFGDAGFYGSMGGIPLNQPIVGMAATPEGGGYWEVAADGGIFSFGDAGFYGSMGGIPLNQPIVGMAATPDGGGYWEVAADGGIFSFGDAAFYGSAGGEGVSGVVGMAAMPTGGGYWLTTTTGAVFTFGRAPFEGSLRYIDLAAPVVGICPSFDGNGYWLASSDGGVFTFGDATYFGRAAGVTAPVDGIT